jgi:hypothetical protein
MWGGGEGEEQEQQTQERELMREGQNTVCWWYGEMRIGDMEEMERIGERETGKKLQNARKQKPKNQTNKTNHKKRGWMQQMG